MITPEMKLDNFMDFIKYICKYALNYAIENDVVVTSYEEDGISASLRTNLIIGLCAFSEWGLNTETGNFETYIFGDLINGNDKLRIIWFSRKIHVNKFKTVPQKFNYMLMIESVSKCTLSEEKKFLEYFKNEKKQYVELHNKRTTKLTQTLIEQEEKEKTKPTAEPAEKELTEGEIKHLLKTIPARPNKTIRTPSGVIKDNTKAQKAWDDKYGKYKKYMKVIRK